MIIAGNIAIIRILKHRLGALEHSEAQAHGGNKQNRGRTHAQHRRRRNHAASLLSTRVGLFRPRGLLVQNGLKTRGRGGLQIRHPGHGKHQTRLGVLARIDARHGKAGDRGTHIAHLDRCVQGPVAPRAHTKIRKLVRGPVLALYAAIAPVDVMGPARETKGERHVMGRLGPAVTNKLPIQLRGIGPRHDGAVDDVGHHEASLLAGFMGREDLDGNPVSIVLHGVDTRVAIVCRVHKLVFYLLIVLGRPNADLLKRGWLTLLVLA